LRECFPGIVFNAAFETSLPTTLNVSVPGVDAQHLIDLLDAAGLRVSGGSACSAVRAEPSYVLQAMGLPAWQTRCAVRLSFGLADDSSFVDEACARLRDCGKVLRSGVARCGVPDTPPNGDNGGVDDDAGFKDLEMSASALRQALQAWPRPLLVDVREEGEQVLRPVAELGAEPVPLSCLADALPRWSKLPPDTVVVFVCRTGKRSTRAAHALRRQGHANAWSLAGGLALWPPA
jgi:rhodanese-related sulfurtransferase